MKRDEHRIDLNGLLARYSSDAKKGLTQANAEALNHKFGIILIDLKKLIFFLHGLPVNNFKKQLNI